VGVSRFQPGAAVSATFAAPSCTSSTCNRRSLACALQRLERSLCLTRQGPLRETLLLVLRSDSKLSSANTRAHAPHCPSPHWCVVDTVQASGALAAGGRAGRRAAEQGTAPRRLRAAQPGGPPETGSHTPPRAGSADQAGASPEPAPDPARAAAAPNNGAGNAAGEAAPEPRPQLRPPPVANVRACIGGLPAQHAGCPTFYFIRAAEGAAGPPAPAELAAGVDCGLLPQGPTLGSLEQARPARRPPCAQAARLPATYGALPAAAGGMA